MPGLVPGIHVLLSAAIQRKTWMAATTPARTSLRNVRYFCRFRLLDHRHLSPHRRKLQRNCAGPVIFVEVDPLVDRMRLVLSRAERHGGDIVTDHPVGVEPAVGRADRRLAADGGYGLERAFDDRQGFLLTERVIVGLGLEFYTARLALAVLDLLGGIGKRRLVGLGDLFEERPVV